MTVPEPLQIKPQDIIKRPDLLEKAAQASPQDWLKQVKGMINQAKEIKGILDEMGIDIGGLGNLGNLGGILSGKGQGIGGGPQPAAGGITKAHAGNFVRLLMARYGDIPMSELAEKLKEEFGPVKISSFLQLLIGEGGK